MSDRSTRFEPVRSVKARDIITDLVESQRRMSPEEAGREDAREAMSEARAILRSAADRLRTENSK